MWEEAYARLSVSGPGLPNSGRPGATAANLPPASCQVLMGLGMKGDMLPWNSLEPARAFHGEAWSPRGLCFPFQWQMLCMLFWGRVWLEPACPLATSSSPKATWLGLRGALLPGAKPSTLANQRVVIPGSRGEWSSGVSSELMWILFLSLHFCQSKLLPLFGWGTPA